MNKFVLVMFALLFALFGATGFAEETTGEALFKKHCALCHPNGGNIIRPEKTLLKQNLHKKGITAPEDIVKIMRNPGPGMKTFGEDKIPDEEAKKIAEYILKTFQ